ncbi:MAG TPA: hypothetical protein VJ810_02425 [Blastocatellia bacterium]|nr:hypothetical protein [Blastocatellia bacterium]
MLRKFFMLVLFGALFSVAPLVEAQKGSEENKRAKGVPEEYAGNWVCQTFMPGYNILLPNGGMTNKATTPSTVVVLKFALKTDGVYEASNAKGHYSFDSATKAITWLDGPHQKTFTKTQIGKRENGAPKMGFVLNKRYYGCFMSKPRDK